MARKRMSMSDQIRAAIDNCGQSRYAIWKATGVAQSHLSEFVSGRRGLSLKALDKLADRLDLNVTMAGKRIGK